MKLNAAMLEDQWNTFDKMRGLQSKQFKDYRVFSKIVAYFQCPLWILFYALILKDQFKYYSHNIYPVLGIYLGVYIILLKYMKIFSNVSPI